MPLTLADHMSGTCFDCSAVSSPATCGVVSGYGCEVGDRLSRTLSEVSDYFGYVPTTRSLRTPDVHTQRPLAPPSDIARSVSPYCLGPGSPPAGISRSAVPPSPPTHKLNAIHPSRNPSAPPTTDARTSPRLKRLVMPATRVGAQEVDVGGGVRGSGTMRPTKSDGAVATIATLTDIVEFSPTSTDHTDNIEGVPKKAIDPASPRRTNVISDKGVSRQEACRRLVESFDKILTVRERREVVEALGLKPAGAWIMGDGWRDEKGKTAAVMAMTAKRTSDKSLETRIHRAFSGKHAQTASVTTHRLPRQWPSSPDT
ncbi:hypothetical protein PYCC9005_004623 [Savitreella phatthalungensis]